MGEGRHFKASDEGGAQGHVQGAPQSAPGASPAADDARPAAPRPATGQPSGPVRQPAGGVGSSQDTMQFIALANASRPAGAGAGSRGRRTPPSAAGNAAAQDRSASSTMGGAAARRPASGSADAAGAQGFARAATGRRDAVTPPAPAYEGEKAEYYDFNIPYGGDGGSTGDDGLVRHRHRRGGGSRRSVGIIVAVVLAVLVIALGAGGFALYRSVSSVKDEAREAVTLATGIKDKLMAGDFASLPEDAKRIDEVCASIQDETNSPLWQVASFIPVVGSDVNAARTLVNAMSDVSSGALVPISDSLADATPGKLFADGAINVSAVDSVVTALGESGDVISEANEQVQAIGDTHIAQVTELVDTAKGGFAMLDDAVDLSQQIGPVLPAMLGADGERTYLIAAENNAEIRSLGGFCGAAGILTVDNGVIELEEFESTQKLNEEGPTDKITISDEERELFQPDGETLNFTGGDSFFVPDFPRGSELLTTIWGVKHDGQQVDGVFAIDPIFLQYMLGMVGGVTAVDGTQVDGTNAAQVLLSDVYWNYPTDSKMQDAVFASVASAAFDKLVGGLGSIDFAQLFDAVGRGASEGRLLIWMDDEAEEDAVRAVGVDGALPTDPADPQTGVYVNNYSYSKLDWYLDLDVDRGSGKANGDGTVSYSMMVTLTNTMTEQEAADLPAYVQAHNASLEPAEELLRLYLYAPMGGSISGVTVKDGELNEATHNGLQVLYDDVHLMPGESYTVTYTVTVPAEGADKDLQVRATPTAQEAREGTL